MVNALETLYVLTALLPQALAQQAPPRFLYVYRDSLKSGVDSVYSSIEDHAAQICANLRCPNPYLGLESLSGPHEAWWLNAFVTEADTARVARAYAANRPLTAALDSITQRKSTLVGVPIQGFAVYRPELSRGTGWSVGGARFLVVTVTRNRHRADGWVWEMADSTLYIFRPVRTRPQAEALAADVGGRIFAVRPNWSMPASEWVAADPGFWRLAPQPARTP